MHPVHYDCSVEELPLHGLRLSIVDKEVIGNISLRWGNELPFLASKNKDLFFVPNPKVSIPIHEVV